MAAWKVPSAEEERECLIAEMEAKFQALPPHRQRAFLWALEHMDWLEALAEKANGELPPREEGNHSGTNSR